MKMLVMVLLMVGSSAVAAQNGYELALELEINDKEIASPMVRTREGANASVIVGSKDATDVEYFIDVVVTENKDKTTYPILMKFKVGSIDKNGKKNVLATPSLIVQEGVLASISESSTPPGSKVVNKKVYLSVIANRKSF